MPPGSGSQGSRRRSGERRARVAVFAAVLLVLSLILAACGGTSAGKQSVPGPIESPIVPHATADAAVVGVSPAASPAAATPTGSASPGAGASPIVPSPAAGIGAGCGGAGAKPVTAAEATRYVGSGPAIVVVAALNLRSGPSTDCPRTGSMRFGTSVVLDGALVKQDGHVWRHLRGPAGAGYAVADTFAPMPDEQPTHVPILMYHHINAQTSRYFVSPAELDQQMKWLHDNGYISITPSDLSLALFRDLPLPAKPVMLTIDDGDAESMEFEQILAKYGFRGVYFLPNYSELSKAEINELAASGEVCGHTVSHPDLSKLSYNKQEQEIAANKVWLEGVIGQSVGCFAYPFGRYSDVTAQILADAGYDLAFNAWGPPASLTDPNRWHIPRVEIDGGISLDKFIKDVERGG